MTRPFFTCITIAPFLVGVGLGCQGPNPAFNADTKTSGDATSGDSTDTKGEESTTTASTSDDGDGDGDGDGDPTDTSSTAPDEGGDLDLPPDGCVVESTIGLRPRFGSVIQFEQGLCPAAINEYVRVIKSEGGDWVVNTCTEGCLECDEEREYLVGAKYLDLALLIPPVPLNPNALWQGCYFVQAGPLVPMDDPGCIYASLSVHTHEGPSSPLLFNANRDSAGLTQSAITQTFGWEPVVLDQENAEQCACDVLDIDCCPGHTVIAKKFGLGNNVFVYPGQQGAAMINQQPWLFYGAQAQSGFVCGLAVETSWAISPNG